MKLWANVRPGRIMIYYIILHRFLMVSYCFYIIYLYLNIHNTTHNAYTQRDFTQPYRAALKLCRSSFAYAITSCNHTASVFTFSKSDWPRPGTRGRYADYIRLHSLSMSQMGVQMGVCPQMVVLIGKLWESIWGYPIFRQSHMYLA